MDSFHIKDYLTLVAKPGRYINNEINSIKKELTAVRLRLCLAFPDAYEVGTSHLGLQILYQILNRREDIACERVYAPWPDMEKLLREMDVPLSTLESKIPLAELDLLGFSLQYELSYTNILNILDLGRIPLYARARGESDPIVIGGGPCAFNPEPIADFFDAFLVGDGEEAVIEIAELLIEAKDAGRTREEKLKMLSSLEGIYIPSFFDVYYNEDNTIHDFQPILEGYTSIKKRTIADLNVLPSPTRPVVPFVRSIHDRLGIEIARGCTRGCRFCQAGIIYRPLRERDPHGIVNIIKDSLQNTGYDEVSLLSLSTGDYSCLGDIFIGIMDELVKKRVSISLPSMRVGTLDKKIIQQIKRVRKTGFTLAPEAGTERLRCIINKGVKEKDLLETAANVFSLGWNGIKLYFMTGLPTETDEDIKAIVQLAEEVRDVGRRSGIHPAITVSASTFIPKAHTPFQWEPMIDGEKARDRLAYLKRELNKRRIDFRWQDVNMSLIEGMFSRGDRRLASLIVRAFKKGCRFDAWGEQFKFDLWEQCLEEAGIDIHFYISRRRSRDEILPWDHIVSGVKKGFLLKEYDKALADNMETASETPDCRTESCSGCGVCDFKIIKNVTFFDHKSFEGHHLCLLKCAGNREAHEKKEEPVKIQLTFTKRGDMRFLSHLEMATAFSRAVRRAGLPVSYSKGYHPLPKISFSPPIPLGMESMAEIVEVMMDNRTELNETMDALNNELPLGLRVIHGAEISLHQPSISAIINEIQYLVSVDKIPPIIVVDIKKIEERIKTFFEMDRRVIQKKRKRDVQEIDIMPFVKDISFNKEQLSIHLTLKRVGGYEIKPRDILSEILGLSLENPSIIPTLKVKSCR